MAMRAKGTPEQRFWAKVDQRGPDECWEWIASRTRHGYGSWAIHGVGSMLAHRYAYENAVAPIPDGLFIRHTCDNPPCVNPAHLLPGTHEQNMQDMMDRGRHVWRPEVLARIAAERRAQPTCSKGHPRTPENTHIFINKRHGWEVWECRPCRSEKKRRLRAEAKAAAASAPLSPVA